MAMDLNAKAAYIRGLMTGMEFDADSKNGKVIAAMMDLLEEMAATVTEHDDALDQVYDELETLDQDLDDVVSDIYGDDEEDDDEDKEEEDHGALYEVTCPNCGEISTLDEETLMDPEGDLVCPHCGATFDIELEGTEEDSAEETDKQDREGKGYIPQTAKSPQPSWLRGFCCLWGRGLLLLQCALQHNVTEGQCIVQADLVGLTGNALRQGLRLIGGEQHNMNLIGHIHTVLLLGGQHLQIDYERILHRAIVNIVAAAHQRAALIGQLRGISHI